MLEAWQTDRRRFLVLSLTSAAGVAAAACGAGAGAQAAAIASPTVDPGAIGDIYRLQAAFHRAKTTQDLDLMLSLWADDATLTMSNGSQPPIKGTADLRTFWANSGSYKNRRFSLVPSFKTQINVTGDQATLYFECHDIGDFDTAPKFVGDTFLAGTLKKLSGRWLFWQMTAGPSSPLSIDHFYMTV